MANGDTSPSRVGQVNSAGDTDALFLKKFSGEILPCILGFYFGPSGRRG